MDRVPADERRAFSNFVRSNFRLLRRYVQRRLHYYQALGMVTPGDAHVEDVLHEAVVAALRRIPEKRSGMGLYPWFRRIADTVLRRQAQRSANHRRRTVSLEEPIGLTEEGESIRLQDILPDPRAVLPAEVLEHHELQQMLDQTLQRLPDEWREAFLLFSVDGYSIPEIAALEGQSPDVIRQDIRLAREFLQDVLTNEPWLMEFVEVEDNLPPIDHMA